MPAEVHNLEEITLPTDGASGWAGMRSLKFRSPNGKHIIEAPYESEPPHGDSIHRAFVDGVAFLGLLWGCNFAWSPDSAYFVASWMAAYVERRTVVIDVAAKKYSYSLNIFPISACAFRSSGRSEPRALLSHTENAPLRSTDPKSGSRLRDRREAVE
jgi:hypothetical protein